MGEIIRQLREARGMTRAELADAVGVGRGAVANWEAGRSLPRTINAVKLADLFEVRLGYLVGFGDGR